MAFFNTTGAWSLYLEGDEVLHERDIKGIRELAEQADEDPRIEAIAFKYHHFYGTPDQVATGPAWYRVEPRMIRNHDIRVIAPDGLFFVVMDKNRRGRYPKAIESDATIHHYGWVRSVESHDEKLRQVSPFWGEHRTKGSPYEDVDPTNLKPFAGAHPEVMRDWLENKANREFNVNPDYRLTTRDRRQRVKRVIERFTGLDLCKRHHHKIRLRS